ncbi:MAG: hypothetical protein QM642_09415 [Edaphocola sp.]
MQQTTHNIEPTGTYYIDAQGLLHDEHPVCVPRSLSHAARRAHELAATKATISLCLGLDERQLGMVLDEYLLLWLQYHMPLVDEADIYRLMADADIYRLMADAKIRQWWQWQWWLRDGAMVADIADAYLCKLRQCMAQGKHKDIARSSANMAAAKKYLKLHGRCLSERDPYYVRLAGSYAQMWSDYGQ